MKELKRKTIKTMWQFNVPKEIRERYVSVVKRGLAVGCLVRDSIMEDLIVSLQQAERLVGQAEAEAKQANGRDHVDEAHKSQ